MDSPLKLYFPTEEDNKVFTNLVDWIQKGGGNTSMLKLEYYT